MFKSRRMRWVGHVTRMEEKSNVHTLMLGKTEGKRSLRKPRHRWLNNILMDFGKIVRGSVDWIDRIGTVGVLL
jgi:hypothetical protein